MEFPVLPGGDEHRLEIRFVGSGSEYFRIWIVNLLLTLVTVGIYYPFAKVRRMRYFHGATEVGGYPLSYHADPMKVLRGYAVVAAMAVLYGVASWRSPPVALAVLLVFAVLWPALWHSSLRFRLANTGWRGLRLQFLGTRRDAYVAMAPAAVLGALFFGLGALDPGDARGAGLLMGALALLPPLIGLAVPALWWRLRRYQHSNYGLAGEQTRFLVPMSAFYGVSFRAGFVATGVSAVAVAVAFGAWSAFGPATGGADDPAKVAMLSTVPVLAVILAYQAVVNPYVACRMQNLVWNGTRSGHLRFDSQLRFGPLLRLSLRNWLLVVVTLGLYLPFAQVAMARLRLQAVALRSTLDPQALLSAGGPQEASALGDAAGDVAGIDLGL